VLSEPAEARAFAAPTGVRPTDNTRDLIDGIRARSRQLPGR
jgi:hypothetical protein